jgi:DNA mismatch repair protein MutL
MNNIRILPPEIASKIAAGEVIERPASVLKELIENSLDAGAERIDITVEDAGKKLIRVSDNGKGIGEKDIPALFNRHATSKIASIDDLYSISSLGFRGEALYSVSAVADVTLRSKTADADSGWETHIRGGQRLGNKPVTMTTGTDIGVQELFFNTPARKKFLKSNTSELNAMIDIVVPYTLLHPGIQFYFTHEKRKLIDAPAAKNHAARIAGILHIDKKNIIEDSREYPGHKLSLRLFLGDINIQRGRKDMQFIFVNGRPVQNKTISFHVNEIYKLLLAPGTHPFFCVFVEIPAADIDANVHPAKREIKIRNETSLVPALRQFTEHLLMTRSRPRQGTLAKAPDQRSDLGHPAAYRNTPAQKTVYPAGAKPRVNRDHAEKPHEQYEMALRESIALYKTGIIEEKKSDLKEKLRQARYLGNLLRKYILFETGDSMLIIDQHAAQERISFERLKNQIERGAVEVQPLLSPILMRLSQQEILLWEENGSTLENLGFNTSMFDKTTLAIHSHPQLIDQPENSVRNLLAGEKTAKLDPEKLARMACRSSVMAGFAMNPEQAEYQRASLLQCADPFICPHGRPTVIEIAEEHLSKQFLRT